MNKDSINCKSEEGITIGLIDNIILCASLLKRRDLKSIAIKEALLDLESDKDVDFLMKVANSVKEIKEIQKKYPRYNNDLHPMFYNRDSQNY